MFIFQIARIQMNNRNARQPPWPIENDQLLRRRINGQNPGRIQSRNQRYFNRVDMNRRNLLIAVLSNVDDLEIGDERRNTMVREVFRHVDAALNVMNQFEMGKLERSI